MTLVETYHDSYSQEQVALAEEEIQQQKREWELEHLQALKADEDKSMEEEANDEMLTYPQSDAEQVNKPLRKGKRRSFQKTEPVTSPNKDVDIPNQRDESSHKVKKSISPKKSETSTSTKGNSESSEESDENEDSPLPHRRGRGRPRKNAVTNTKGDGDSSSDESDKAGIAFANNTKRGRGRPRKNALDPNTTKSDSNGEGSRSEESEPEDEDSSDEEYNDPKSSECSLLNSPTYHTRGSQPKVNTKIKTEFKVPIQQSFNEKLRSGSAFAGRARTRSKGTVNVNLWTLDINPILPGEKPVLSQSKKAIAKYQEKGLLPKFMNAMKVFQSASKVSYQHKSPLQQSKSYKDNSDQCPENSGTDQGISTRTRGSKLPNFIQPL